MEILVWNGVRVDTDIHGSGADTDWDQPICKWARVRSSVLNIKSAFIPSALILILELYTPCTS